MYSNSKPKRQYRKRIIEEEPLENANLIRIGSKVQLRLFFSEDDFEDYSLTICSNPSSSLTDGFLFIEAPLAQCISGNEKGFVGEYRVNGSKIKVSVLEVEN